jgi:hypothetical protein
MKKYLTKAFCMLKKHEIAIATTLLLTILYAIGVAVYLDNISSIKRHQSVTLYEMYEDVLRKHPQITEETFEEGRKLVRHCDTRLINKWFNEAVKSL